MKKMGKNEVTSRKPVVLTRTLVTANKRVRYTFGSVIETGQFILNTPEGKYRLTDVKCDREREQLTARYFNYFGENACGYAPHVGLELHDGRTILACVRGYGTSLVFKGVTHPHDIRAIVTYQLQG